MDYIISRRLSSDRLYAYHKNRFWFWDEERCIWKESHLLSQRFEREHAARPTRTPETFMQDLTKFQPLDDYELDSTMLDALKDAKPCKTAPIEPVEEEPTCATVPNADAAVTMAEPAAPNVAAETLTTSESVEDVSASSREMSPSCSSSAPSGNVEGSSAGMAVGGTSSPTLTNPASAKMQTAFDFSALGDLSTQASEVDQQFDLHYSTAQDEYLISCIYVAQMHALTAKAGRYGGGTWTKWYESKGMSEGSARTMVQNGQAFKSATVADLKLMPAITRKDLNLIARSGCVDQLVEAAGDSQRVQELLAQLKLSNKRADDLQAHNDKLTHDYNDQFVKRRQVEQELEETRTRLKNSCLQEEQAHDALQAANAQLEATQADVTNLQQQYAQMSQKANDAEEARIAAEAREEEAWQMQSKAEARAKNAEDALKKQPITGVVDKEEVQRQAKALADQWREEEIDKLAADKSWGMAAARNAELQADKDKLAKDCADLKKQMAQMRSRVNDSIQADFENANKIPIQLWTAWNNGKDCYTRLTGEDLESTFLSICDALDGIKEEVARLCRQPADYDGGKEDE